MKLLAHFAAILLALYLSPATAGSHSGKPAKSSGKATTVEQPDKGKHRSADQPEHADPRHDANDKAGHDGAERGNERSREMLERRDERKEAKEEYKRDRVPGQEGKGNDKGQPDDKDAEKDADKPWYDIL